MKKDEKSRSCHSSVACEALDGRFCSGFDSFGWGGKVWLSHLRWIGHWGELLTIVMNRLTKRNEAGWGTQRAPLTFSPRLFIFDTWANDSSIIYSKCMWKSWTTLCRAPQTCLAEDGNCVGPWHFVICGTLLAWLQHWLWHCLDMEPSTVAFCWCDGVRWGMAKPRLSAELFHFADHGIQLQSCHASKSNWLTPTTKPI